MCWTAVNARAPLKSGDKELKRKVPKSLNEVTLTLERHASPRRMVSEMKGRARTRALLFDTLRRHGNGVRFFGSSSVSLVDATYRDKVGCAAKA